MPGDLPEAGLDVERRIPGAARRVEAVRLARLPIGEGGVDETRIRHAVEELVAADPFGAPALRQQAPARRPLDLGERRGVVG